MSSPTTLGAYLRRSRESCGLSVERVSAGSRIAPRLVEALEEDRHDALPAPVYVRGFIRAYCGVVGSPPDEALALYEAQVPAARREVLRPPSALPPPRRDRGRRKLRPLLVGGAVTAAVLGGGIALLIRWTGPAERDGAGAAPVAVSHPGPTAGSPGATPGAADGAGERPRTGAAPTPAPRSPETPAAGAAAAAAPAPAAERVLVVRALEPTWIRVQPDGAAPAAEETLAPGEAREWRSPGRFLVSAGSAGGIRLELDGRVLPALGSMGEAVRDVVVPAGAGP
jgi:cytoskeleton protein RodZ